MKLPVQAKPVERNVLEQIKSSNNVSQSGVCEILCDLLPGPAKGICKAAC
ncbi:MAG: hypothetical protein N2645_00815 [Clostridia bacterium]|nr:hypothetical protein [Clostridia bacterium]